MARKVTISREVILDAALNLLIRDGYQSVNIKTLSAEIGCSTQPVVWHFGNMEGLRKALYVYAAEHSRSKSGKVPSDPAEAFKALGRDYIRMAVHKPNLFKFLYLGEGPVSKPYTLKDLTGGEGFGMIVSGVSEQTGLTEEQTIRCIRDTIIYSHGLAAMVATGVLKASERTLMSMVVSASEGFVRSEGGVTGEK